VTLVTPLEFQGEWTQVGRHVRRARPQLSEPILRSLDALHLASALSIATDLTAFIAYDRRLAAAAAAAGLPTVQPGA
jgi:predicted nucleic acid-binding protein